MHVHLWSQSGTAGEALLMTPFFFIASAAAFLTTTTVDGFSMQLHSLDYSMQLLELQRVEKCWDGISSTTLFIFSRPGLVFGTNFFHYATYDSVCSHV